MLFYFSEMGFTSPSLFLVFFFFQCLLFSEKTRDNLGKLILNHGVFHVFIFISLGLREREEGLSAFSSFSWVWKQ